MSLSLYKQDIELNNRLDLIEFVGGEVTEEEAEELNSLMISHKTKALGVSLFIKRRQSEIDLATEEKKKFNARIKTEQNKVDYFKSLLVDVIDNTYDGQIENGLYCVKTAKVPASVLITDEEKIPDDYRVKETTFTISKTDIKADLKSGKKVPGAVLVTDKKRLNIKG